MNSSISLWASFWAKAGDAGHAALGVDELGLDEVEIQAAVGQPAAAQQAGQVAHLQEVGHERGQAQALLLVAVEDLLDGRVGQTLGGANERGAEFGSDDFAGRVDLHLDGKSPAVLARAQAADVVGQALGQHGQGQAGEIDAGGALVGLVVEGRAGPDIEGYVGDMDA